MSVSRKRLHVDWGDVDRTDLKPALTRFKTHLKDIGFRDSTIGPYVGCVKRYLNFAGSDRPTREDSLKFRESLHERGLSRSSINNYSFAIKKYHEMLGEIIEFPFMKRNDDLPYYFDENDVLSIFSASTINLKHYAMLQTLFYGCLRASELCNLDDPDLDLKSRTIRILEGKGGRDGVVYISDGCVQTLKRYLAVRPSLKVDGRRPLFYTDFGNRWTRGGLHRMFVYYKKKAGVEKHGGIHVFSRHSPATIMIANGCDIRIVQELLRHRDIRTTVRYAHVSDKTKREKYERFLSL